MQRKSTYDPTTGELLSDSFEIQTVEKLEAQRSMHSGETRPEYLNSGDLWLKTKNGIAVGIYQWFDSNGVGDGNLISMIPASDSVYQEGISTVNSVTPKQVKQDINGLQDSKFDKTGGIVNGSITTDGVSILKSDGSNTKVSNIFYDNSEAGRSDETIWIVEGGSIIGGFSSNSEQSPNGGGVYTQKSGWTHPAPLPQSESGKGQVVLWSDALPSGGTWMVLLTRVNALDYKLVMDYVGSILPGGTNIRNLLSAYNSPISGVAWRIA